MFELVHHVLQSHSEVLLPGNFLAEMTTALLSNKVASEVNVLRMGIALLVDGGHGKRRIHDKDAYGKMGSAIFLCLSALLPASLKRVAEQHMGKMGCPDQSDVSFPLCMVVQLIEMVDHYDDGVLLDRGPSFIRRVYRSCLKTGISDVAGPGQHSYKLCLRLIRHLLLKTFGDSPPLKVLGSQLSSPSPDEVFSMVVSHSKFQSAMSFRDLDSCESDDSLRLELTELLTTCVKLAPDLVEVDADVNYSILAGFNASLSDVDVAIRRFYFILKDLSSKVRKASSMHIVSPISALTLSTFQPKQDNVIIPHLDEFRWNAVFDIEHVTSKDSWEWFLHGLDSRRIRATLMQFPVYDSFHFDSATVMTETSSRADVPMDGGNESVDNFDVEDKMQIEDSFETNISSKRDRGKIPDAGWRGEGPDIRFSPSCILPLILGSLESGLRSPPGTNVRCGDPTPADDMEETVTISCKDSLAMIARRLCSKGALSLALAALCSKCLHVRKLAVSSLGLFLAALDTKEAHEDSSWRERPQLAMILNAVQRALSLIKGRRSGSNPEDVPVLPVFVALFLARSALIMSSPEDCLFVPLNRIFLKTEENHGAFQDTNRLPAFISLFCSSSDDHEQARRERLWALHLLENGCIDQFSFRLAAACHAPELILTAFDNIRGRATVDQDGNESSILLDAVASLIACGGRRAITHLVCRMGLLSWLRSISVGRQLRQILPTAKSMVSFLKLISISVERATALGSLKSEVLMEEICVLATPVIKIFFLLTAQTANETGRSRSGIVMNYLSAELVCKTLGVLTEATQRLNASGANSLVLYSDAVPLELAVHFLDKLPETLGRSACSSLSSLPIAYTSSKPEDARKYCNFLLDVLITGASHEQVLFSSLDRLKLLVEFFGGRLDTDGQIIRTLVSNCRCFLRADSTRDLWLDCLSQLTRGRPAHSLDIVSVASGLVKTGGLPIGVRRG